jgi:septal ring factor EnvC (AmiA/AmiB activator)
MSTDDALAKSLDEAIEGAAGKERRFWIFTVLWVLGSGAILWFLWSWSSRLDALSTQLTGVEKETVGLVESARQSQNDYAALRGNVEASRQQVVEARAALATTQADLEVERDKFEVFAASQRMEQQQFRASIEQLSAQYTREIERLNRETAAAQQRYREVETSFTALRQTIDRTTADLKAQLQEANQQVTTMRDRVRNVERQLQVSHFVLQTRSRNRVYGMDIYIGFGAWNKSRVGLNDFCVSTSQDGDCFCSREFVPLGEPIPATHDGFAYTITPRYAVGMLLAHDHVGFDILREALASR